MSRLVPCQECQRHVRVGGSCPFCGAEAPVVVTEVVRPRAHGRFAMLFAGSIALSACGEQASQDLAPPPGSEAIPSAETAPTEGAAPAEVAEGEAADAPAAVAEGEAADAPAAVAEGEAADAPAAVAEGEAAEVAPEAVSPGSPGQQERAQVARERRRANAPAETAGGADQAVAGPDEAEDIGAVAAYGGPALRAPVIPERERMVPLYGGPSIDIDDR